jgi:hypothetical protein
MGPTSAIKKPELAEGSRLAVDGHGYDVESLLPHDVRERKAEDRMAQGERRRDG